MRGGGGGPNRGTPRPSAQELMRSLSTMGDDFFGASISVSKAKINSVANIMDDPSQSLDYFNPQQYNNLAGEPANFDQYFDPTGQTGSSRPFYEIVPLTGDLRIPGEKPNREQDSSPADLTLVPTSTTNPDRPRTVAAGYDEDEEKLTVVFRDGTFYNYYEVDKNEWAAFKANRSKGAVIYRMLDFKPRGPADISTISKKAQEAFYRYSRGFQLHQKGKGQGKEQSKTTFKTYGQSKRTAKSTGKNPAKGGRAPKRK